MSSICRTWKSDSEISVIVGSSYSSRESLPLKSNRFWTSRRAWSTALVISWASSSETVSKEGIGDGSRQETEAHSVPADSRANGVVEAGRARDRWPSPRSVAGPAIACRQARTNPANPFAQKSALPQSNPSLPLDRRLVGGRLSRAKGGRFGSRASALQQSDSSPASDRRPVGGCLQAKGGNGEISRSCLHHPKPPPLLAVLPGRRPLPFLRCPGAPK